MRRMAAILALGLGANAWAADKAKSAGPASHALYASDGANIVSEDPLVFAVVGNTRQRVPALDAASTGRAVHAGIPDQVISDIAGRVIMGGPEFLVHLGDGVRGANALEWGIFDNDFHNLLDGSTLPDQQTPRIKAVPVAGDREAAGDKRFEGWGKAFPGVGAVIGYNRVGSWHHFDVEQAGHKWRFIVLDAGKKRLGSRWLEQKNWITKIAQEEFDSVLVFMHDPVFDLGGKKTEMNPDGGPAELIAHLEEELALLKLRAVFTAGHHTTQVIRADGPFGALHVGAGGGGAPADVLNRWGGADDAGRDEDIQLEPMFDMTVMDILTRHNRDAGLPDIVMDQARAEGSYKGFTAGYDPKHVPLYGWWEVEIAGEELDLRLRIRRPDGSFVQPYAAHYEPSDGWKGKKLSE